MKWIIITWWLTSAPMPEHIHMLAIDSVALNTYQECKNLKDTLRMFDANYEYALLCVQQ